MMGGRRARRRQPRRARGRRRSPLQHGDQPRGGLCRQDRRDRGADQGHLQDLLGHRRQARLQPEDLPDLRRPRPGALGAGLLLDRAHLPDLPGPRLGDLRPLPGMPRRRPRDRGAQAVGQHSRPASRTAPASGWPARARRACAAGRRATSTSSCRSSRTTSSSATAPTSSAGCRCR